MLVVGAALGGFLGLRFSPRRDGVRLHDVRERLSREARARGSALGAPVLIRIFKQSRTLELWLAGQHEYILFKSYPICSMSGALGPKTTRGDRQAPEGLYQVGREQLNPRSRFHLSMNLGYPNAYESAQGFTGDALMIHGDCVSVGCYAMGDRAIREIYTLVEQALERGQASVPVHAFPFPLSASALEAQRDSAHYRHWRALAPAYAAFERERVPPHVTTTATGYRVSAARD